MVKFNNNLYNGANYIHTVLEFRRYNKFVKYEKFTLYDSVLVKLLAEGKLEEFVQGKPVELSTNIQQGPPPPPSNINRQ